MLEQKLDELTTAIKLLTEVMTKNLPEVSPTSPEPLAPKLESVEQPKVEEPAHIGSKLESLDAKEVFKDAVKRDKNAVKVILNDTFNAKRFSDVPEDQHAALIEKLMGI